MINTLTINNFIIYKDTNFNTDSIHRIARGHNTF